MYAAELWIVSIDDFSLSAQEGRAHLGNQFFLAVGIATVARYIGKSRPIQTYSWPVE